MAHFGRAAYHIGGVSASPPLAPDVGGSSFTIKVEGIVGGINGVVKHQSAWPQQLLQISEEFQRPDTGGHAGSMSMEEIDDACIEERL